MSSYSDRKDGGKPMPPSSKCTFPKIHQSHNHLPHAEPVIRCSGSENQNKLYENKKTGREGLTKMDDLWRMVL
jgi:hypothetical protein